ncbi:hypothetical protein FRC98_17190 [Lujinxingia vulgaris]|uniref:Uncharacterized protein n=1 Tax=Lujinxingia vulgaris TaxID=2600176 RepID=A0A5C6XDN0_9DELT|nr:hypothetical protein [Lujinxingia vulgaris]TXD35200.1 hypothetical protein FRC98_17190 [Lujinxingia vulgaris]
MDESIVITVALYVSLIALVVGASYAERRWRQKSSLAWQKVAEQRGLLFRDRGPEDQALEGRHRGYELDVHTETRQIEVGRSTFTAYLTTIKVTAREPGVGAAGIDPHEPYPHGSRGWKAKALRFEQAFRQRDTEVTLTLAKDPAIRQAFEQIQASGDNLILGEGQVRRTREALLASPKDLVAFIDSTIDLVMMIDACARKLSGAGHTQHNKQKAEQEVPASASSPVVW